VSSYSVVSTNKIMLRKIENFTLMTNLWRKCLLSKNLQMRRRGLYSHRTRTPTPQVRWETRRL